MSNTLRTGFELFAAAVVGRDHAVKRRNCQDAVRVGRSGGWVFGVVSDGCGQGMGSELGASMSAAVVSRTIARCAEEGAALDTVALRTLGALEAAFGAVLEHVVGDVSSQRAAEFVRDHLLATTVAFVATANDAIAFAFGDGLVLVDDEVVVLSQDNKPSYPAYALFAHAPVPRCFRLGRVDTVGVATDGLDEPDLRQIGRARPRDLQRAMRVLQQSGSLEDDGAAAMAVRQELAPDPAAPGAEGGS